MEELKDLKEQYEERFDECFPSFLTRGKTEYEIKKIIIKCLKEGKPYIVPAEYDY